MLSFIGGVNIKADRRSVEEPILTYTGAKYVKIPLKQHIGLPCVPVVAVGDTVNVGQLIGEVPADKLGCRIHASISGVVKDIVSEQAGGITMQSVIIEGDGENKTIAPEPFEKTLHDASIAELIDRIRLAGVVGMGGAGFPTWEKLRAATGNVTKLLINCSESDPYITSNARLVKERSHDIISGIKVMMKILRVKHADIYINEAMYKEAYELLDFIKNRTLIDVRMMKNKYPQGDERLLLAAAYKIELPYDKLPLDSESIVFNVNTCLEVYDVLLKGLPVTDTVITLSGDALKEPRNLRVPIGLPVSDALAACGGVTDKCSAIVTGGVMTGKKCNPAESVVTKQTLAITALKTVAEYDGSECVRCGRCENVCPMHIPVSYIYKCACAGLLDECKRAGIMQCTGCGCCSYICVGSIPLSDFMIKLKLRIYAEEAESIKAGS